MKFGDRWDFFGAPVKSFNFEGRQKVHTKPGLICSALVTLCLTTYALHLFIKLSSKSNPNVYTQDVKEQFSSPNEGHDLSQITQPDFQKPWQMAFAMRNYNTGEILHNHTMIEYEVHVYTGDGKGTDTIEHQVGVHVCNETDYANFYGPFKPRFEMMRSQDAWMCMDQYDKAGKKVNTTLFGQDENTEHRRYEVIYKPCTPRPMNPYDLDYEYFTNCFTRNDTAEGYQQKLNEIKEWIGQPELILAYNEEQVDFYYYGQKSINRVTAVLNYQWSTKEPSFLLTKLH